MIKVQDNWLPEQIYSFEKGKLLASDFERVVVGEKDFHVVRPDEGFLHFVAGKLSDEYGADIEMILSFYRLATNEIDTDWRIHSDLNINGQRPSHAGVLYFSTPDSDVYKPELESEGVVINPSMDLYGTAFWSHRDYGSALKPETTDEEYNRLLEVDANDISRWELDSIVSAKENRLLTYQANLFHSKYPNRAWSDSNGKGRMVLVMFFNVK